MMHPLIRVLYFGKGGQAAAQALFRGARWRRCYLDSTLSQRRFMDGVQHLADPQAVSHGWVALSPSVNRGSEVTRQQSGQAQPRLVARSVLLEIGRYTDDITTLPGPPHTNLCPSLVAFDPARCGERLRQPQHTLISVDLDRGSGLP